MELAAEILLVAQHIDPNLYETLLNIINSTNNHGYGNGDLTTATEGVLFSDSDEAANKITLPNIRQNKENVIRTLEQLSKQVQNNKNEFLELQFDAIEVAQTGHVLFNQVKANNIYIAGKLYKEGSEHSKTRKNIEGVSAKGKCHPLTG